MELATKSYLLDMDLLATELANRVDTVELVLATGSSTDNRSMELAMELANRVDTVELAMELATLATELATELARELAT